MLDELCEQAVEFGRRTRTPLRLQSALDHATRAATDQVARGIEWDGRQALLREHPVQGVDEVRRSVDQSPVEIEDDRHGRHAAWLPGGRNEGKALFSPC